MIDPKDIGPDFIEWRFLVKADGVKHLQYRKNHESVHKPACDKNDFDFNNPHDETCMMPVWRTVPEVIE